MSGGHSSVWVRLNRIRIQATTADNLDWCPSRQQKKYIQGCGLYYSPRNGVTPEYPRLGSRQGSRRGWVSPKDPGGVATPEVDSLDGMNTGEFTRVFISSSSKLHEYLVHFVPVGKRLWVNLVGEPESLVRFNTRS